MYCLLLAAPPPPPAIPLQSSGTLSSRSLRFITDRRLLSPLSSSDISGYGTRLKGCGESALLGVSCKSKVLLDLFVAKLDLFVSPFSMFQTVPFLLAVPLMLRLSAFLLTHRLLAILPALPTHIFVQEGLASHP